MDKELKLLQETICCGCPYGADNMKACDIYYCDKKEAFGKVKDAYKNIKKDLAGRQKKIESLSIDFSGMKASRDYYKENYEVECAKNRNLYAKYISVVKENAELKLKGAVMEDIIEELQDTIKKIEDTIRSLEDEVKHQDSIILKQRKIIQIQDELLTEVVNMHPDDALVKAIKELQDEKEKIIKEV